MGRTANEREGGVKMAEWENVKFISSHKYIKNTSTNGTSLTEHLLDISGKLWTTKRTRRKKAPCNQVG